MGRALLVYRLTVRDLRHHAAQAVLLVIAIAAATATLTMALVHERRDQPALLRDPGRD